MRSAQKQTDNGFPVYSDISYSDTLAIVIVLVANIWLMLIKNTRN